MITGILIAILVMETIRFVLYIQDSIRVKNTNKMVSENQAKYNEMADKHATEIERMRKAEIEELKELAKTSDTMKQIYDEWIEMQGINKQDT